MPRMKIVALSGSLRAASVNSAFCRAAVRLAPASIDASRATGLEDLPLFNPDLDSAPPASVQRFRKQIGSADALIIASPEYAHGVSGVMKNALDWLVSDESVVGKPVALINTSPRAHHAYDSLAEILRTMSIHLVPGACLSIPLLGYCTTEELMLASEEVRGAVVRVFAELSAALAGPDSQGPSFPLS